MTLKEQVLELVETSLFARTNYGIAGDLNAPEPSVRRATKQLADAGEIVATREGNFVSYTPVPVHPQATETTGRSSRSKQHSFSC